MAALDPGAAQLVRETATRIDDIENASLEGLLERLAGARLVLIGESTHGTREFYRMRARLTRELIATRGFSFVAVEADWPDAARVDDYVRGATQRPPASFVPFQRFPRWMWRNAEAHAFVEWLRAFNDGHANAKAGFHGLDLYSLFTSIDAVVRYLADVDPPAAEAALGRCASLTAWQKDPLDYGRAVRAGECCSSERAVMELLTGLLEHRHAYVDHDAERFFDATQNARVAADAERYYRTLAASASAAWNLRDTHMFETLRALLGFYGPGARGVVWEHNSHVGAANATGLAQRGQHSVGQLCRAEFGDQAYLIGQGTDHGTVIAAAEWNGPMLQMELRPGFARSYEQLFHDSGVPAFTLGLRDSTPVRDALLTPRLERAIGVVYRPSTERGSHYFDAVLPLQFDELIWFDETHALQPLR